jgi:hypothetical protein
MLLFLALLSLNPVGITLGTPLGSIAKYIGTQPKGGLEYFDELGVKKFNSPFSFLVKNRSFGIGNSQCHFVSF